MIDKAIEILRNTQSLFVLTGAGISAESGIPTFRGADGLWKNYSATDLATPEAFNQDPALVWTWYRWRQDIIKQAHPNPGHTALVDLETTTDTFLLLTQNVDNLHQQAGSRAVLELHGNIFRARCTVCGALSACGEVPGECASVVPVCSCGGMLRPDVVWFGEAIPQGIWHQALAFLEKADAVLICGTSGIVWPAAAIPGYAREYRIPTLEINIERTLISDSVDVMVQGKAGDILPKIVQGL